MKKVVLGAFAAAALVAASSAGASSVGIRVQNSTTAVASPTYLNTCAAPSPALTPVSPGATTGTSTVSCGQNSAVAFDYTSGAKVCRFNLSSLYTPGNPILGTQGYWTPTGTGTSRAGSARCTVTLTNLDNFGNYAWTVRIQ